MSAELKVRLAKVAEEDFKQEQKRLEDEFPRLKTLLLKIAQLKGLDVTIWIEGTKVSDSKEDEEDLRVLERANLVKGKTKFTHRNVYRHYELTQKGAELAEKLTAEQ
ncbi:MAG: hypothetical protein NWF05_01630 [Candidatus Bathyarchaeota archaeon]|nr:hypothetical protein [Candidatus Bathyarchaeota archaeon]